MRDYKLILKELDTARGVSNGAQYDRAVLLVELSEHPGYLAVLKIKGKRTLEDLDLHASGMFANFTELKLILKKFPKRVQWVSGNLREMRSEMIRSFPQPVAGRDVVDKKGKKKNRTRNAATLREVKELEDKLEKATLHESSAGAQIKLLNDRVKDLEKQLVDKARRIERLEADLDAAQEMNRTLQNVINNGKSVTPVRRSRRSAAA